MSAGDAGAALERLHAQLEAQAVHVAALEATVAERTAERETARAQLEAAQVVHREERTRLVKAVLQLSLEVRQLKHAPGTDA